jgi:hypothetical protein
MNSVETGGGLKWTSKKYGKLHTSFGKSKASLKDKILSIGSLLNSQKAIRHQKGCLTANNQPRLGVMPPRAVKQKTRMDAEASPHHVVALMDSTLSVA